MAAGPRTPVLVGVGQYVGRESDPARALSPADMLAEAARAAIANCGADAAGVIDTLVAIRLFADSRGALPSPFGAYRNLPHAVARRIGAHPRDLVYGPVGGNTPQMFVNELAARIAKGDSDVALIVGGEALRTQARAEKAGLTLDWGEDAPSDPASCGEEIRYASGHEIRHGIALPTSVYPLFENAFGAAMGWSPLQHRAEIGHLMAPFSAVAAENPFAQRQAAYGAEALVEPGEDNRIIAYPYTKRLCANMFVDQAAAVLMMSTEAADRLGVPADRRVYLHGSADTHEKILLSERIDYATSPAIYIGAAHALAEAGITPDDLSYIDLYSCFPVAVEIAAAMIGLPTGDPARLTLTGGLPYFGGPGNAYSLHAIAEVVEHCRNDAGAWGFVFANGGFLTKHSFGVYSTSPGYGARSDPASYQAAIDAMPSPPFTETPAGEGRLETFTVVHHKGSPMYAIIIGRLDSGARFLARMHAGLEPLMEAPIIGHRLRVTAGEPNIAALI
ncbi:acetyl-CoA acetyltransferase [Sphingosinicella soli]|uniref:Acetyl-CoA C-acetyltransferase n=1 Tax=Sphingosinicella soli TaxID=333708 RepID=A0A7W7B0J8_9SPHN|nr:acetyl-CoA acetyltransferase [Sphingosinicella soli]MBB4631813.1 acetyl-CoA C-acetyltransferase [Sphingosinicella soli]